MTNYEYYSNPEELLKGFERFCEKSECASCKFFKGRDCLSEFAYEEYDLENDLKPCPFCNGNAILINLNKNSETNKNYIVKCKDCSIQLPKGEKEETIKNWNKLSYEKSLIYLMK